MPLNASNIRVEASFAGFEIAIAMSDEIISDVHVEGLTMAGSLGLSMTTAQVSLRAVSVTDPSPETAYNNILVAAGEEVFSLRFTHHHRDKDKDVRQMAVDDVDIQLKLSLAETRVVCLQFWFARLVTWITPFHEAAARASELMQEGARHAAVAIQEMRRTTKMALRIKLNAPVIIFPLGPTSDEALLAHLGRLFIKNRFTTLLDDDGITPKAVLDDMSIKLRDMQLSRVLLDADRWKPIAECSLLDGARFNLHAVRNLSFDYFKVEPEIKIVGKRLPRLKVSLSREDYEFIMKLIMALNFSRGDSSTSAPPSTNMASPVATDRHSPSSSSSPSSTAQDDSVQFQFLFKIRSITAQLFIGSSNLRDGGESRDAANALAACDLSTIDMRCSVMESGQVTVVGHLQSLVVNDTRVNRAGINRLLYKKGNEKENMVDFKYCKEVNGEQRMDIGSKPFFLYLCPEFLGELGRFFVLPTTEVAPPVATQTEGTPVQPAPASDSGEPPAAAEFNVYVQLNSPEIALVENANDQDGTQAVILKFNSNVVVQFLPAVRRIWAHISELNITACYLPLAEELEAENPVTILSPCDAYIFSPEEKDIRVEFPERLQLRFSPSVIRLLSAIVTKATAAPEAQIRDMETGMVVRQYVWDKKNNADCNFWFLNEVPSGAGSQSHSSATAVDGQVSISFWLEMAKIDVILEADSGRGTVPMIHVASSLHTLVNMWSTGMEVKSIMPIEIWYRNEQYNAWEPLLERVEGDDRRPWTLELSMLQLGERDAADSEAIMLQPKLSCEIMGNDHLQLTVTKTLLDVLTELSNAFTRAAMQIEQEEKEPVYDDYWFAWTIKDMSGLTVMNVATDAFELRDNVDGRLTYLVPTELVCKVTTDVVKEHDAAPMIMTLQLMHYSGSERTVTVNIARAEMRCFEMDEVCAWGSKWNFVVDSRTNSKLNKLVAIRSPIRFVNRLPIQVELYSKSGQVGHEHWSAAGCVDPNGGEYSPTVYAAYRLRGELAIKPGKDYEMGKEVICWPEIKRSKDWMMLITCRSRDGNRSKDYYIQASAHLDEVYYENSHRKDISDPCYLIYLSAPTTFVSGLPYPLEISSHAIEPVVLAGGESKPFCSVVPGSVVKLKIAADTEWTCEMKIEEFPELSQHTFRSGDSRSGKKREMDLGVRAVRHYGTQELTVYCPFWMVNKTERGLVYKAHGDITPVRSKAVCRTPAVKENLLIKEFHHDARFDTPVLFAFSGKAFFKKNKKASLRISTSQWSSEFPLNLGSTGRIECKTKSGKILEIAVTVHMGCSGLTRICTFTPYYVIDNRTRADVEFRQSAIEGEVRWVRIPKQQCRGFWPDKRTEKMQLSCRYADTRDPDRAESQPFPFTKSFQSLVTMPNEFVGVYVSTHVSETAVVSGIEEYDDGMAPALLVNNTADTWINYRQKGIQETGSLPPGNCVLFSWTSVMMDRVLLWACDGSKDLESNLLRDGSGVVRTRKGAVVFWVSFLSGRQRVLLFTQDLAVATTALEPCELERAEKCFTISFEAINVSLVNNLVGREVASVSILGSGPVWEYEERGRFKAFGKETTAALEAACRTYVESVESGNAKSSVATIDKTMKVNFAKMKQLKPVVASIQRRSQPSLWLRYSQHPHALGVHLKMHHLQVDNVLPVSVFETVLSPVPQPPSVVAASIPSPFLEASFVMRDVEHCSIPQIRYCRVLIQEMAVQLDKGFINAMIAMFTNETSVIYGKKEYDRDVQVLKQSLSELAAVTASTEQKAFYELLHLAPIKLSLSVSQGGSADEADDERTPIRSEIIELLMKTVGVTLTELQDAQFRFAFLEFNGVVLTRQQLTNEIYSHYILQALRQFYRLVLGLDILGNPFGLIRDLSVGVETFFYEPIQGAIQGPEEVVRGIALGVQSLVGGVVGGTAAAAARITGTLGKALAALTMDKEYQKKRLRTLRRRPASAHAGFLQGVQGLAMGFVEGVSGVVTKPVQGARTAGFSGFAKGVAGGFVGLFTRPLSGAIDFTSSSLQAVRRITHPGGQVKKVRHARFIDRDKIVRPYSAWEAEGNHLLQEVRKGEFAKTDVYVANAPIRRDKNSNVIVTDQRIMLVKKDLGAYSVKWWYAWKKLAAAPSEENERTLRMKLKVPERDMFGKRRTGLSVEFASKTLREMIEEKAKGAYERAV